jgi:hypothetical protein
MNTYIKTTESGLRVEVIGAAVCLDGKPEAQQLVELLAHPNRAAILRAVPAATHMAGRIPLTHSEAGAASSALYRAKNELDPSPRAINERLRRSILARSRGDDLE